MSALRAQQMTVFSDYKMGREMVKNDVAKKKVEACSCAIICRRS